jgi:hypothetical protein
MNIPTIMAKGGKGGGGGSAKGGGGKNPLPEQDGESVRWGKGQQPLEEVAFANGGTSRRLPGGIRAGAFGLSS